MNNNNNITNNKFVCNVLKKSVSNIDEFRCFWATICGYLFYYDFGYYCMGLLALIILLSIFGGIKEVYRWFILNQAIWDFMLCYDHACAQAFFIKGPQTTCFYDTTDFPTAIIVLLSWIFGAVAYTPYNGLFLLSMSRFIALYYNNLYKRLTKRGRVIFVITFVNALQLIFSIQPFFLILMSSRIDGIRFECAEKNLTQIQCNAKVANDTLLPLFPKIIDIFSIINSFFPPLQLLLSIFAATKIIQLLAKQSKFQFAQNRKDFYNSARICTVILVQNFATSFVFLNIFLQVFRKLYFQIFNKSLYFTLPLWFDGPWGIGSANLTPLINLIRIFIEAIVILFFMSGYREALWTFIKVFYFSVKNPQESLKKIKFSTTHSNVTVIASSRNR